MAEPCLWRYHIKNVQKNGGRGGIRTHDTVLPHTRFPSVRLQPLGHPSTAADNDELTSAMQVETVSFQRFSGYGRLRQTGWKTRHESQMKTGRTIGWALLTLALIMIGHEALNALEGEGYRLIALGELWFRIDQAFGIASLNVSQAFVQRYVWAWLWEGIIQTILTTPTWLVIGIPGIALAWLCRDRGRPTGLRR